MNYLKSFKLFEDNRYQKSELIRTIQNFKNDVVDAMNYANSMGAGINPSFHYGVLTLGELFSEIDKLTVSTDDNTLICICNEISRLGKHQSERQYQWIKKNPQDKTSNYDILKYEFSKKIVELTRGTNWDITNRERIISEEDIEDFREIMKDLKLDNLDDMEDIWIDLSYRYDSVEVNIRFTKYRTYDKLLNLIRDIKPRIDHILGISIFIEDYNGINILLSFSKLEENKKHKIIKINFVFIKKNIDLFFVLSKSSFLKVTHNLNSYII